MKHDARTVLAGAAAHGLPQRGRTVPAVTEEEWPQVVRALDHERLTGLALAAVADGRLDLSEAQALELVARQRAWMDTSLRHERRAARVVAGLAARGIDAVLLKGPAFAHGFYPDPAWRPFRDVDVLVRTPDWYRACAALTDLGYTRVRPEPRPGFDVRFGKGAVHRDRRGMELDLHRTLVVGPFGLWVDVDELTATPVELVLGDTPVACLDASGAYVHAVVHAVLGGHPPPLLALRDIVQVEASGLVDWDRVSRWVHDWRLAAVVDRAFELVQEELGHAPSSNARAITRQSTRARGRRALRAYLPPRRARGGPARATLQAIPGLHGKLGYIRALAAPTPEFLAARVGRTGARAYVHRWAHAAAWFGPDTSG